MARTRDEYGIDDDCAESGQIDHLPLFADDDEAIKGFARYSPAALVLGIRGFWTNLLSIFGPAFVGYMMLNFGLIKGFSFQMIQFVQLPYFKELGVDGATYQKLQNVTLMAFAMKPAVGVISDGIPILGYNKRVYCVAMSVLGTFALVIVNFLPIDPASANFAALCMLIFMIAVATLDLLNEAKYSEWMAKDTTGKATSVVTLVWMSYTICAGFGAVLEGTLSDAVGPRTVIWIACPCCLLVLVPLLRGWLPEGRLPPKPKSLGFRRHFTVSAAAMQHKGTLALGVAAAAVAVILAVLSLLNVNNNVTLGVLVVLTTAVFLVSFGVLPITIAKANLYIFLQEVFYMQINGALDYYYTADGTCTPDGPQFSYTYYQTVGNVLNNVSGLAGTIMFERFLMGWSFRGILVFTTFLRILSSFFDFIIAKRWNVAIGLSDKATYVLGDAILYQTSYMLGFMATVVLMSRLCPKGMESTIYALLAGFSNLGQTASRMIGFNAVEWLGIRTNVPCDFTNLPDLIVIAHGLMPLMSLPLIVLLLPSGRCNEAMEDLDDRAAPPLPDAAAAENSRRSRLASSQYAVFEASNKDFVEGSSKKDKEETVPLSPGSASLAPQQDVLISAEMPSPANGARLNQGDHTRRRATAADTDDM